MNNKIVISILLVITITVIGFSLIQNEITEDKIEEEPLRQLQETDQISSILEKIEQDRIENEKRDTPYIPKEREWIKSGPFQIDRSEYVLGEKVFINVNDLPKNTKGKMVFSKIINNTHSYEYKKLNFDSSYTQKNFYIGFTLNPVRGLCSADMLIGDWEVIFEGTPVKSLKFKVIDKIIPGMENLYDPVC
jgi:hypothetical protein